MCCGEAFWKRVVAFCLTFGLGVFVAGLFISKQTPQAVKPFVPAAAENKNCVPADKSLKYEKLPHYEEKFPDLEPPLPESDVNIVCEKQSGKCHYVVPDEKNKTDKKQPEDKKESLKAEPDKQNKSAEPQYYDPSKDSAEFKELLHKERCFEAQ